MVILGMFFFLAQIDKPTINLLRSFEHPLLDQIGTIGNRLGDGLTLVMISLGIGAVGFYRNAQKLKILALQSLVAHGLAGLIAQIIKHSIGRPRPRHMDKGPWEIQPSFESGYDSFPSGHASASFAVATTLAFHYPRWKVLWFGLAAFISTCRVTKGSHFPTDVLGGILVGIISGMLFVYSKDMWKKVGQRMLSQGLPWLVTAFGLTWILVPHPGIELEPSLSLFIAFTLLLTGLGLRLFWLREASDPKQNQHQGIPLWPRLLMGLGLASGTGSLIFLGVSVLAGTAWWVGHTPQPLFNTEKPGPILEGMNPTITEAIIGITMILLSFLIFAIRTSS